MSRLFTHHDRLYLFQSSFFTGTPSSSATREAEEELGNESNSTQPKSLGSTTFSPVTKTTMEMPTKKTHSGLAVYIPHFHKMFGLLAIINMLLYLTPMYQTVAEYFGPSRLAKLSCVHVILALSSFEFRIGRARNGIYTIYREMQLHTVIFTMRSWTVLMCDFVLGIDNLIHRSLLVLFWHVLADVATKFYRPPSGETTIRRSVDGKTGYQDHGRAAHLGLWFFSFSQLAGTFLLLVDSNEMARNAMFVMTPVQISALLATLVRKGYFSSQVSVSVYFLVLQPMFFYHHWTLLDVACMAGAQLMRFNLRLNKYVMWLFLASVVGLFKGDLHAVARDTIAPLLNNGLVLAGQQPLISPEVLQWLQVPPTTVVPAWMYTDTFQAGAGIGNLISHLSTYVA